MSQAVMQKLDEVAFTKVLMRGINTSRKDMFMTFLSKNRKCASEVATFKRYIREINISHGAPDQDPTIFSLLLEQVKVSGSPQWLYLLFSKDVIEQYHFLYVCCNYVSGVVTRSCPTLNGKDLRKYWKENFDELFHKWYIEDMQAEQQSKTDREIYEKWIQTADDLYPEQFLNKKYSYTKDPKDKPYTTVMKTKNSSEFINPVLPAQQHKEQVKSQEPIQEEVPIDEYPIEETVQTPVSVPAAVTSSSEPAPTPTPEELEHLVPEKSWMTLSEERISVVSSDLALKLQDIIENELSAIRTDVTKEYTKTIAEAMAQAIPQRNEHKQEINEEYAARIRELEEDLELQEEVHVEALDQIKSLKSSMNEATNTILEQKEKIAELQEQIDQLNSKLEEEKKAASETTEASQKVGGNYSAVMYLGEVNNIDYHLFITRKSLTTKLSLKIQSYNRDRNVFLLATSASKSVRELKQECADRFDKLLSIKDTIAFQYSELEWEGMRQFITKYRKPIDQIEDEE